MSKNDFSSKSALVVAKSIPALYVLMKNIKDSENSTVIEDKKDILDIQINIQRKMWEQLTNYRSRCNKEKYPKKCFEKLKNIEDRLRLNIEGLKLEIQSL